MLRLNQTLKSNKMNHIKNERGKVIIACGQENSPIRFATRFPDSILKAIELKKQGVPFQEIWGQIPNVTTEDKYYFANAVDFYFKRDIIPTV